MSFYRERQVKVPRKKYICECCREAITGAHTYISSADEWSDFTTFRAHNECLAKMKELCNKCPAQNDCSTGIADCFYENFRLEEKTES